MPKTDPLFPRLFVLLVLAIVLPAKADTMSPSAMTPSGQSTPAGTDSKGYDPKAMQGYATPAPSDWSVELRSGTTWSNVRTSTDAAYTIVPINLTANLKLDEVSNDNFLGGIFRGNTEFVFRGEYDTVVHGPETRLAGFLAGPLYNFVQKGWPVVPYIESQVGILFADAQPEKNGLGQDFNFTFTTGAGIKVPIDEHWYARVGVEYQHVSNAGLSEPAAKNNAIDAVGPKVAVGFTF